MDVVFHLREGAAHQFKHAEMLCQGIKSCGDNPSYGVCDVSSNSDVEAIWSWKQMRLIRNAIKNKRNILVMERGFIPNRMQWCSLAINGLNGKGKYTPSPDNGERFADNFGHLLKPWRYNNAKSVLLIGQVYSDPSMYGTNHNVWLQEQTTKLKNLGYEVIFRQHPWVKSHTQQLGLKPFVPAGAILSENVDLYDDFDQVDFCVTFNSNTAVEAVLYGLPTVTFNDGSIAYEVTSHNYDNPMLMPDRHEWCNNLAWKQWEDEELIDGTAWEHVRKSL